MQKPEEKRKHARVAVFLEYGLELDNTHYTGFTGNISMGGVYLRSTIPPMSRDKLTHTGRITLNLDGESITLACQIVFIGGDIPKLEGIGVAFVGPNPSATSILQHFLLEKL